MHGPTRIFWASLTPSSLKRKLYAVEYDDGDAEELTEEEVRSHRWPGGHRWHTVATGHVEKASSNADAIDMRERNAPSLAPWSGC